MRFSELEGARVGVWGAGREIVSFAAQLTRRLPAARIAVAAFDEPPRQDVLPGAEIVLGAAALQPLAGCDVVVRSPGVSIHRSELRALRERGTPVTTATSLWLAEHGPAGVVAVTGTKGKSTTAALAHHLALAAGVPADLAGNIGVPALDLLDAAPGRLAIVELSSYQIADLQSGPVVATFVNLYPEHADWHGSEQAYRAEKLRLLTLPEVRVAVLPARQAELASAPSAAATRRLFGAPEGWDVQPDGVAFAGELRIAREQLPLPGEHNALNLCAALSALQAAGVALPDAPGKALAGFAGLEHRLQTVAQRDGVRWVDDSISTTPESTLAALASFPDSPIVLLAGGQDRGQDHGRLARELARRQVDLIGLPSTGPRLLAAALQAGLAQSRTHHASDLEEAVRIARERAVPGAVAILSPAAPSYDHYRDFQERGERFRALLEAP